MKHKLILAVTAAALALLLAGCGSKVTSIAIPQAATVEKGERITLPVNFGTGDTPAETPEAAAPAATAETAAGSKTTVTWTSSDERVATVDETGSVTAVAAGKATITAAVADTDLRAACTVTVKVTADGLTVPDALEIKLNDTDTAALDAVYAPEDATDVSVRYATDDEAIATVDAAGVVTAHAPGACTVTAALLQDGVVVTEKTTRVTAFYAVEGITLDKTEGILYVGGTVTLTAAVTPQEAADPAVLWSSDDESVAVVDADGTVTAVAPGQATITAACAADGSVRADYALTVQQKKAAVKSTAAAPSYTAPAQTVTPEAPAAETPAPDPAPAPAEPAQPSGGDGGNSGDLYFDDGAKPEDSFGYSSGIDWTQDNSNGSGGYCEFNCG